MLQNLLCYGKGFRNVLISDSDSFRQFSGVGLIDKSQSCEFIAKGCFGIVDYVSDALFVGFRANEEYIAGIGNNIVVKIAYDDEFFSSDCKNIA